MSKLSTEEAIKILEDMKIDIPVPKAAVTQIKRNSALDMAVDVLSNYLGFPNGWVPCSIKKHPDSKMECYVTVKDYTDDYGEEYDLIVDVDTYYPEDEAWDDYCDLDIIAWMPKPDEPEPYQPKEDNK